jgi:hypothetical protein
MRNQLTPLVVSAVAELGSMSPALFQRQLPWLYGLLCDLIGCSNHDLRLVVAGVFRSPSLAGLLPLRLLGAAEDDY